MADGQDQIKRNLIALSNHQIATSGIVAMNMAFISAQTESLQVETQEGLPDTANGISIHLGNMAHWNAVSIKGL